MSVLPKNGCQRISRGGKKNLIRVKYLSARLRKDHEAAYKKAFQLGVVEVDDQLDEDPGWTSFVEARRTCCICLSIPADATATALTPCVHVFCRARIDVWLQAHNTCPVCREHLCKYSIQKVPITYVSKPCRKVDFKNSDHANSYFQLHCSHFTIHI